MENQERNFTIGLIGLNIVEISTIKSICHISKATRNRSRTYRIIDESVVSQAEILIVNSSKKENLITLSSINQAKQKPVIFITDQASEQNPANEYFISRRHLSSSLLALLDKISVNDLGYLPELVVGGNNSTMQATLTDNLGQKSVSDGKAQVLIIDDSQSVRTQMSLFMKLHGIHCDFSEDGETGVQLAKENRYSLIFLDVVMPGMDGYKACKYIKADPTSQKTPVILLTSKNSPFDKVRGVMSGCDKYITKPIDSVELEQILHEFIPSLLRKRA